MSVPLRSLGGASEFRVRGVFPVSDKMIIFEKAGCGPQPGRTMRRECGSCLRLPVGPPGRKDGSPRDGPASGVRGNGRSFATETPEARTMRKRENGTPVIFLKRSVTVNGDAVAAVRAGKHVVPTRNEPGKTTCAAGAERGVSCRIPQGGCFAVCRAERRTGPAKPSGIPCGAGVGASRCPDIGLGNDETCGPCACGSPMRTAGSDSNHCERKTTILKTD